jgi:hypothetical protein
VVFRERDAHQRLGARPGNLDGGAAVAEAAVGEGKVFIMGPEVTFRGEPHTTFKLLFNAVLYGSSR